MLSVRTLVNSRISQKLVKDADAPYHSPDGTKLLELTSTSSDNPTFFPTLNVNSLGEPSAFDDLEHKTQAYIFSTIELKAYTQHTGSTVADARTLLNYAGDIMLSMGYELFFGPQDLSTDNYNCVVARFRRYVGDGDKLF